MPAEQPMLSYLHDLHAIRNTGAAVAETSYYPALEHLLNSVGRGLRPAVRCVMNLRNRGGGMPDGGLFTAEQLRRADDTDVFVAQLPTRGALEVKGTGDDIERIARSEQVGRYLARYGQVLVTNLRDFVLVAQGADGAALLLERYRLAANAAAFWSAEPAELAAQHGEGLLAYLERVLLSNAPLADPRDLARFLASYARDARARIAWAQVPALAALRRALEESLGIAFQGERGEHFFRSTLVQTLFYGVFSAWVLWCKEHRRPGERFDWRSAAYFLRVPMIEALFQQVAAPNRLRPLGLMELLDWTAATLNRVDVETFFTRFEETAAVQYFYEPFLEAFDPELRRQLGVWYTPPEIVRYQVARVDAALREELGVTDGLADPRVVVLDPCCGTGAYLVGVLEKIAETLDAQGGDALQGDDLKRAALSRVFGFELLPAPFVVAHLQLGLLLRRRGVALADDGERVGVYLTNALTGWEPPDPAKERLVQQQLVGMPELQTERDLARHVKRDASILVILGNPPYSGYAGISQLEEERDLSTAYRSTRAAPPPQGQGLNDLYVRFFRMAERRIVEQSGRGIVCFISNYSWLDGLSFTGMRERYLDVFDKIWIDNLNGDKYKTGKVTPEGLPDPSVFSTPLNPEGIQVGTAITLLVRREVEHTGATTVFRHLWGRRKREALLESLDTPQAIPYQTIEPQLALGLPLVPTRTAANYLEWPLLPGLFPTAYAGVKTSRDSVVVDIDRERLEARMRQYFDPTLSNAEMARIAPDTMEDAYGFNALQVRTILQHRGFLPENIVRYCYRPFDVRWLYWEPEAKLLDGRRPEYIPHVFSGNMSMVSQQKPRREWSLPQVIQSIGCLDLMDRSASIFPLYLLSSRQQTLFDAPSDGAPQPNLSERGRVYLAEQGADAEALFFHAIATLHAPAYRAENGGALRQDWPRVPLPATRALLDASAALGRQVAALLDSETAPDGLTQGAIRPELRNIAVISRVGGGALQPAAGELDVTANWGYGGRGGITMPGRGRADARAPMAAEGGPDTAAAQLYHTAVGELRTYDVYLNNLAFWRNIPERVWEYTIGGYQVIKKWLSYRERELLGRGLRPDEAREVTQIARRVAAILLLEPALDASYRAVTDVGV